MKAYHAVLLAVTVMLPSSVAQARSDSTEPPSQELDWSLLHGLGSPLHTLGAPVRAVGKLFRRFPPKPSLPSLPHGGAGTGPVAFVQVQATSSSLGAVGILNTNLGYGFTPHLTADIGLPLFSTRSPFPLVPNKDWRYTTWIIGEPYLDFRYTTHHFGASITSILTGTAPVSTSRRIFSTGRFGVDWTNHLEHNFKGFTPFLNAGASNGTVNRFILPRPYTLARPYQTLGFMSDFEGGASFTVLHHFKFGASAYALEPAGPQKVFSRLVAPDSTLAGDGHHNRFFDSAFETVGTSQIARDNGYSGWFELGSVRNVSLQVGLTHSVRYAFDSLSIMLNFDGSFLFKERKP